MDYDDFPEKYASRHLKIVKVLSKEEVFELLFPKEKRVYSGLEYFNAAYYGSNPITGGLEKQKIKRIITFEEFIKRHENINPIFFNEIYEIVSK